jgi:hypothetical protein
VSLRPLRAEGSLALILPHPQARASL